MKNMQKNNLNPIKNEENDNEVKSLILYILKGVNILLFVFCVVAFIIGVTSYNGNSIPTKKTSENNTLTNDATPSFVAVQSISLNETF